MGSSYRFAGIVAQERKVERGKDTNTVYIMLLGHESQVKGVEFHSLALTLTSWQEYHQHTSHSRGASREAIPGWRDASTGCHMNSSICKHTTSLCQWPLPPPQRSACKAKEELKRAEALWSQYSDSGIWELSLAILLQPHKRLLIPTYVAAAAPRNLHVWPLYNILTNTTWKVLFTQLIDAETETQPYHVIFPTSQNQCHHESLGVYSQWLDTEQSWDLGAPCLTPSLQSSGEGKTGIASVFSAIWKLRPKVG